MIDPCRSLLKGEATRDTPYSGWMGNLRERVVCRSFLFFLACREFLRLRFRPVTLVLEATPPSFLDLTAFSS